MSFIPKYSWLTKKQQEELKRWVIEEMDAHHEHDGEPLSETAEGCVYIRAKAEDLLREE